MATLSSKIGTIAGVAVTGNTNTFTAPQLSEVTAENDGSIDLSASNYFTITPTGNFTLSFTNLSNGQAGNIMLMNTGGYAVSKASTVKADSSFLTTVSTAGTYWLSYNTNGTNVYITYSGALS